MAKVEGSGYGFTLIYLMLWCNETKTALTASIIPIHSREFCFKFVVEWNWKEGEIKLKMEKISAYAQLIKIY